MKLFKALVGLAAAASVIPLKVEKVEEDGKKTVRISSLTWKAEYTSATEEDDATLNVDLMGGLKEIVKKKEKPVEKDSEEDAEEVTEDGDNMNSPSVPIPSEDMENEEPVVIPTVECDLADRVYGGGIRWSDLEISDVYDEEEEEVVKELTDEDLKSIADQMSEIVETMDKLFTSAIDYVVSFGKASTSMLQRKLTIGYGRAAKIIDGMTNMKIITNPNGAKPRDVLITVEQWEQIKRMMKKSNAEELVEEPAVESEPTTQTETETE
jgi:DNA segregation ATPase FtsK/SpoIIIE-like protein